MQNHGEGWCKVHRGCGTGPVSPGGTGVCGELRHKWQRLERIRDALSLHDLPNICDLCGGVLGSESSQEPSSRHCCTSVAVGWHFILLQPRTRVGSLWTVVLHQVYAAIYYCLFDMSCNSDVYIMGMIYSCTSD